MALPVVVGVDGSARALDAARFAAEEARRRGAPLHLVTVVAWPYDGLTATPPDVDLPALLDETGAAVVAGAAAAVTAPEVTTSVRTGDPVTVLTDLTADAQLLVLGSRGVGGVAGLLLGSVAGAVVAHAHCPVLVLPDDTAVVMRDRRSVVVGVAGRSDDDLVLAVAFAEAASRGSDLVAVHAWQDVVLEPEARMLSPLVDWAGALSDEERALSEALAGWREKEPDVVVRELVVRDRPARALVAASLTAEVLVVGRRHRRALGSTPHGVLHRAVCPVVVVPLPAGADR